MIRESNSMPFDAITLECFLAVTETGSFTRAAHKVAKTQSAISQQIRKLEIQIGKPVFIRTKTLTLTPEGEILLSYAKKIIQLNRDAMDQFNQPKLQGKVSFGLPEDFASVFLSDVLSEYAALHPRILLHVECDLTLNLFERFKQNEFDLVLLKMNRPEDFPNGMDVWSETLEWVGNREYLSGNSEGLIPLVLSPQPCVYRARVIDALEQINRKWRVVFSSHSHASKIAAVRAGMGITALPRNMIPQDLTIIRSKEGIPKLDNTPISLLKHHDHNLAINSFQKFVIDKLQSS